MKRTLLTAAKLLVFLGLGLFLIWLITHDLSPVQWHKIRMAFREANYWLLIPVLAIGTLSHLFRALRWRLLIRPMGYETALTSTFGAVMIGYLSNLALPRMGEITRCGVLSRYEGVPMHKLIGTMIAERAIDMICLLLLLVWTLLVQIPVVGGFFSHDILEPLSRKLQGQHGPVRYLVLPGLLLVLAAGYLLIKQFSHTRWYRSLKALVLGVREGLFSVFHMRNKGLFFIYTLLIWACYFLMVYVGFFCFQSTSGLGLLAGLSVLGFGSIGMIATQGGIGAYQLIVQKILLLYGISEAYGYAFGWLSWLAQTGLILLLGLISLVALPFLKRKHHGQNPVHPE